MTQSTKIGLKCFHILLLHKHIVAYKVLSTLVISRLKDIRITSGASNLLIEATVRHFVCKILHPLQYIKLFDAPHAAPPVPRRRETTHWKDLFLINPKSQPAPLHHLRFGAENVDKVRRSFKTPQLRHPTSDSRTDFSVLLGV